MLYITLFICFLSTFLFGVEHVHLKTPHISRQDVIETTVGIRPVRKTGVRLEVEHLRNTCIIHNYGYGGSGLTLAFGGSQAVFELLEQQEERSKTVAILGAGVIGLATAYDLLEKGYHVHLYADAWSPHLTSDVAAGMWTPYVPLPGMSQKTQQLHQRLLEIAERRLQKSTGQNPEFEGIQYMRHYVLSPDVSFDTSDPAEQVILHFDNGKIIHGKKVLRIGIEGKVFMEDLYSKVKMKGALFQEKHFKTVEDIVKLEEPVIINCLSMGSREIFNDQDLIPVRGQMVHLKPQQGIDFALFQKNPHTNYFFMLYPWKDRILVGGVYEHGEEELKCNGTIINEIIKNAETVFIQ